MDFITGRTGSPHVTSQQFRGILEGIYGSDSYLAGIYDNLAYSIQPANTIQISSGLLIHHGGAFLVPNGSVDEVVYENGTQGTKRIDLIVARYTKDAETDTESAAWVIIKGTETTGVPVAPAYTVGNMQNGDLVDDCPVYAVNYDGLNITSIDSLVRTSAPLNPQTVFTFQCGQTESIDVEPQTYVDVPITFGKAFAKDPVVVVGFGSSAISAGFGSCSCSARPATVTTTGFTARIFNDDSSLRSPTLYWIATLETDYEE